MQLRVLAVPNARTSEVVGWEDDPRAGRVLRVKIAAPPVDGKANAQLLGWLAGELGCPKRTITLLRGDTSRRKQVQVDLPEAVVAAWLAKVVLTGAE